MDLYHISAPDTILNFQMYQTCFNTSVWWKLERIEVELDFDVLRLNCMQENWLIFSF